MKAIGVVLLNILTLINCSPLSNNATLNDFEKVWNNAMGNAANSRRMVPLTTTNFTGESWQITLNASTGLVPMQAMGAGVNGDLYLFLSENSRHSVRWKLYLEPCTGMINVGTSNVVANTDGEVFFTTSWSNSNSYSAKVCRLSDVQTSQPSATCLENAQLYAPMNTPLSLNDASVYLFTTVFNQSTDSVPATIDAITLEVVWIDRGVVGAANDSLYNSDATGIFWIGREDHLHKVNGRDSRILDVDIHSGGNRYYAFDRFRSTIMRAWQNGSALTAPLIVSGWNVNAGEDFHLQWQWNEPSGNIGPCTQPVSTYQSEITYIAALPYLFAINMDGTTRWQVDIVSPDEVKEFHLVSMCLALNTDTNLVYVTISSTENDLTKQPVALFIAAVQTTTGTVLKRINIDVSPESAIYVNCPILIGNDLLYISWMERNSSDSLSMTIMGLPQLKT